jgi:hypothetical protein
MYINETQIVESLNNLRSGDQKINTFIGLLLMIIYGQKKRDNYYVVNMQLVSKHLDLSLYLNETKPARDSEKLWFILFQDDWKSNVKQELLHNKKVSAKDLAVLLFWNENIQDEISLLKKLRESINDDSVFNEFFNTETDVIIDGKTLADVNTLYSMLGGAGNACTLSVDDGKFIAKSAGDLSGAPFTQTLYANTKLKRSFIITDFDFMSHYKIADTPDHEVLYNNINIKNSFPKPFILLAGISGTGKTRFVREQANHDKSNYQIIPVRPDWHEPSDLLGYVSRIGNGGPEYVITDVLKFIVKAWCAAYSSANEDKLALKEISSIEPYWLCLDEMNLAPVEQYFADYLSVLETREWNGSEYTCDALLKLDAMSKVLKTDGMKALREQLEISAVEYDGLWTYFCKKGIPLPPNLIVAGTVNMDETTHGFSRKVLDRAFTIDFGAFFPNDFSHYLESALAPKAIAFGFPVLSRVSKADLGQLPFDQDGAKTIAFLTAVNNVLKDSAFELAYRALNELLLALVCFAPKDELELQAVWDDFMMTKVLPRIEGDADKLRGKPGSEISLLEELDAVLKTSFGDTRPDLFRKQNGTEDKLQIDTRSRKKLQWMQGRLDDGFTSFWP